MAASEIRGFLLDVDGVLHVGYEPIPGAIETLHWLEQKSYPTCFVTNTTTVSRATLLKHLNACGLPISEHQLLTAPVATASYIRQHYPDKRCWLLAKGDMAEDFAGIELVGPQEDADVIVISGAEELLTYEAMNRAFLQIMNGAVLLATHRNRYWQASDGLRLDSGPYVKALEVATGTTATVLGKPDRAFFEQALGVIERRAEESLMVGDDLETDVGGAMQAGLQALLVQTGKYRPDNPLLQQIHPTALLRSIADLPAWLSGEPVAAS